MADPKLLDLFCGAGGAGMGYHRAGFTVTGVDLTPQPHYPFDFLQMDALDTAALLTDFDVIHASPPCQGYSAMNRGRTHRYPMLIEQVRQMLVTAERPFIIENVEGAPLRHPVLICGTHLGLRVRRHRLFEIHPALSVPLPSCSCWGGVCTGRLIGHREGGRVRDGWTRPPYWSHADRSAAVGIDWMTARELRNAIPPAYAQLIGETLLREVLTWPTV